MKDIVKLIFFSLILSFDANLMAKDKEAVYRAVYEFNEVHTYIGNDWESDLSDERSEVKFRKEKPKKTTRQKFLKEKFEYLRQLDGGALTAEFGIKVDTSPGKPRCYRIGLEKD